MTEPRDEARDVLAEAGFEPDFNVCAACGHHGGQHDLGNWCLVCPRPEMPARPFEARLSAGWCYFASMTMDQKWEHGIAALAARGYRLAAEPAPDVEDTGAVREAAIEAVLSEALPGNIYHRLRKALWPQHVTDDTFCLCDGCLEYMQEDAR